jgi:hypothetical protein
MFFLAFCVDLLLNCEVARRVQMVMKGKELDCWMGVGLRGASSVVAWDGNTL